MHDTHAARLWHLSRGKQQRVLVTDQELRRLAQQGRLHPEDLLWRRGFDAWRTAFSIPGLLTPPPLPESDVPPPYHGNAIDSASNFGVKLHKIGILIGVGVTARVHGLLSECVHLAKRCARWIRYSVKVSGRQISTLAKRTSAGSEAILSRAEHPRILACLLAAAVGVGTLDIAMQSSFADSATGFSKNQDRPIESAPTSVSLSSQERPVFPEADIHTLVVYGLSSFQAAISNNSVAAAGPEEQTQSSAQAPIPQELEPVPLPTKKPKKATASANNPRSERAHAATRRVAQLRARISSEPKPMRFGTIGFNYAGPTM